MTFDITHNRKDENLKWYFYVKFFGVHYGYLLP